MVLQCPLSLLSTAILPHSISPASQALDLLLRTIRPVESLKWGWEWQTDVHKHASTAFQKKKHNVLHLSALIADGWDLNGVFGCIILNCIIRNYGPYAMLLWQLWGHSHLHKHATGILMDPGCDWPIADFLCGRSAHPVGLSVEITQLFWQPNIDAFAYRQVILNYIHQRRTHTCLAVPNKALDRILSKKETQWKCHKLRNRHI